jgi:hypothetical protein
LARYSVPMILLVRGDIPSKPFLAELTAQAHQVLDRGGCLWMLITGSMFELKCYNRIQVSAVTALSEENMNTK